VVSVNGVDVSQHRTEREAIESSLNRVVPGADVRYRHDYLVVVQLGSVNKTGVLLGQAIVVNEDS
jgi:hypothetical protein